MKKTSLFVIALVAVSLTFSTLTFLPEEVGATTLHVGGGGPGNYTAIQAAINDANPGDSVFVYNGTYYENIEVDKTLSLMGEDRNTTIIDGNSSGDVVRISDDWVNFTDFTVRNSGSDWSDTGIKLLSVRRCLIANNLLTDIRHGIILTLSDDNTVTNNTVDSASDTAIYLHSSSHDRVSGNIMLDSGIYVWGGLLEYWNTHEIDVSNTVNGRPIHYWKNITGGKIPADAGEVILANCTYILAESLNLSGGSVGIELGFSSFNAIINSTVSSNNWDGVFLWKSNNNTISNCTASNDLVGIDIEFSSNNTVAHFIASDSQGVGISVYDSDNNSISNSTASNNSMGISIYSSSNNTFTGNNISGNANRGIWHYSSNDNVLSDNDVLNNDLGILIQWSDRNRISANTVSSNSGYGIQIKDAHLNTITNNTVLSNADAGIFIEYSDDVLIIDNNASKNLHGIYIAGSRSSTVLRNTMIENGILLLGGAIPYWDTHVIDTSNTVNGKPVYYWKNTIGGIVPSGAGQVILVSCRDVLVVNQNVSNGSVGIQLAYSSDIVVVYNTASSNNGYGIHLFFSNDNMIKLNTLSKNKNDGILATISDSNTIIDNNISSNNRNGIYLSSAEYNEIYHNNIMNNSQQAEDHSDLNIWDDAYPSGGNYWSNYTGTDNFSGPNQDQPGSDGIGDTPYVIDADSQDRYPLMSPFVPPTPSPPLPPQNLEALGEDQQIGLGWKPPLSDGGLPITNYTIYRGAASGSETFLVEIGDVLNYTDSGLINGQEYFYQVSAKNAIGESFKSNEVNATPVSVPSAPQNLQAMEGDSRVDLSWSAPSSDGGLSIANYTIYRGSSPGGETFLVEIGNALNYADFGLINGQTYFYQVSAKNEKGEGPRSASVSATPHPPPRGPTLRYANLSGLSLANVTMTWLLSPDDGDGFNTVIAYEVYRSASYSLDGSGYQLVATLPNGVSMYADEMAGVGDPNDYFYRVCAVDLNNNITCAMDQAAKFTRPLAPGPNLASIPLIQSNESIETVLQTVEYDKAWSYDSSSQEWKWFMKHKDYRRGLWSVNNTTGLWVNVTGDCNLTVAGTVPTQTTIHLYAGWNLVSFPSVNTSFTVGDLRASLPVERVEGFDPAPPHFLRVLSDSDALLAGGAYWVKVQADVVWNVPFE